MTEFDPRDLPDDDLQRAFVLSHHWALMTATRLQLVVSDAHGSPLADASTLVASTESLVAMKLAAARSRREGVSFKRATDLFDVYRLLGSFDVGRAVAHAIRDAPHDLPGLARRLAQGLLVDDAQRSARWMLTEGGPAMQGITAEDLRAVGEPFVVALARIRNGRRPVRALGTRLETDSLYLWRAHMFIGNARGREGVATTRG